MSGLKPRPPKQNRCDIFQIRSLPSATAESFVLACSFRPQDERPLLQSRGCTQEIAAWQAVVETLAKRFYASGAVPGAGFRFFPEQVPVRPGIPRYPQNLFVGRLAHNPTARRAPST